MEMALWVLVVLVFFVGLSMEMKLSRANRIARASHDLLKAILEEQKAAKGAKKEENVERPTPNVQSRMEEKKAEPSVYKI